MSWLNRPGHRKHQYILTMLDAPNKVTIYQTKLDESNNVRRVKQSQYILTNLARFMRKSTLDCKELEKAKQPTGSDRIQVQVYKIFSIFSELKFFLFFLSQKFIIFL